MAHPSIATLISTMSNLCSLARTDNYSIADGQPAIPAFPEFMTFTSKGAYARLR